MVIDFIKRYYGRLVAAAFSSAIITVGLGHEVLLGEHEPGTVTLEGKVTDELYVPPGSGGLLPSEYYLSLEGPVEGRVATIGIQDSYSPSVRKESINARLQPGTKVKVKAKEYIAGDFYRAFAGDIHIAP